MALNQAKIITVTSVKGGTGKSSAVINLAGILASKQLKTVIVDLDLYSGVIAASLRLDSPNDIYTLVDDLMNNHFDNIDDYTRKYNDYIDVLAAPLDPRSVNKIRPKYIDIILSRLKLKYDVVLIDTNHIIDAINLISFDASDIILYFITNDLMDLKNMKTMVSIYEDMNIDNYRVILNESINTSYNYNLYEIKNLIGTNVNYVIPKSFYNRKISEYVYGGKIMTLDKNGQTTKGGQVLTKIINEIIKK